VWQLRRLAGTVLLLLLLLLVAPTHPSTRPSLETPAVGRQSVQWRLVSKLALQ
jgi:hypothetical protein